MRLEGGFINNLSKVYGIYTLGFLGFVILMAILEQAGVSADAIGWMFVGFTIAIYALIGVLSRTMESGQYYVAGREVPAVFNGMATAADWMSGASFIAMAGGIYLKVIRTWHFWLAGQAVTFWWPACLRRIFGNLGATQCQISLEHVMVEIWLGFVPLSSLLWRPLHM